MDISIMTVSLPLDTDTIEEIRQLMADSSTEDQIDYENILNVGDLTDYALRGFCVLAYEDEEDKLAGVITALDRMATLDFEWSGLVLPSFRKKGIGNKLLVEFQKNLALRGALGDLALTDERSILGQQMLTSKGYSLEFTELTMAAQAIETLENELEVVPYVAEESILIDMLTDAFGDTEEEVKQLITVNTQAENRKLFLAKLDSEVVGTLTMVESDGKLWITALAVHRDRRGQGIATSLLNWAKNRACQLGEPFAYLDVETDREEAMKVYQKAGFEKLEHILYFRRVN